MTAEATVETIHTATIQPWKRSWFYCRAGERITQGWILAIHLFAVVGLLLLPLPPWPVFVVTGVLFWLGGLGTTVAYHRGLAHRSVTLHPVIEHTLVFFAILNGSGNPLTWVANHRYHHTHSDTGADVSSPHHGGFWWAHLRWLWQAEQAKPERYCNDMVRPSYRTWEMLQSPILLISIAGGLLWPTHDWRVLLAACLWLGPLRLLIAMHVQCTVNSVCHLGPITGEHGSGRNVWWMAPFHAGQGENWHLNHHRSPSSPRLGYGWTQIDVGWWVIVALRGCGLATKLKPAIPPT